MDKSCSIEEMAKKLIKLKDKKEKLDNNIIDLQSQLDEALKTLGISPRVIYRDNYPSTTPIYIPYNPFDVTPNTLPIIFSDNTNTSPQNFTPTSFDV